MKSNNPENYSADCIVIGGGIIGMTTARELAMRGLSVILLDKSKTGSESSWAAGGILSSMRPWSEDPYSSELSNMGKTCYADFVEDLKQQSGIDSEYFQSGLLMVNAIDIKESIRWADESKVLITRTDGICPANMMLPEASIFLPEIAQVRVSKLLKALRASLIKLGVTILENTTVTDLDIVRQKCNFVQTESGKYTADYFVVSAGAWSAQILAENNCHINVKPVMGQMLCVKFPSQKLGPIVLDKGYYFIPRKDGHVLIGSTMEDVGFAKDITQSARNDLMKWATTLWPDIASAEFVKQWSGLRPATDNGKPYLGKLADYDNVYINTGHFRKGVLQAPVCARKIAELIC